MDEKRSIDENVFHWVNLPTVYDEISVVLSHVGTRCWGDLRRDFFFPFSESESVHLDPVGIYNSNTVNPYRRFVIV